MNDMFIIDPDLDAHYTWLAEELEELEELATELDIYDDFAMEWEF